MFLQDYILTCFNREGCAGRNQHRAVLRVSGMWFISTALFLEEMSRARALIPSLFGLRLQHWRNLHTVTFRCNNFFVDYIRGLYGIDAWPSCGIASVWSLSCFDYFGERAAEVVLDQRCLTFWWTFAMVTAAVMALLATTPTMTVATASATTLTWCANTSFVNVVEVTAHRARYLQNLSWSWKWVTLVIESLLRCVTPTPAVKRSDTLTTMTTRPWPLNSNKRLLAFFQSRGPACRRENGRTCVFRGCIKGPTLQLLLGSFLLWWYLEMVCYVCERGRIFPVVKLPVLSYWLCQIASQFQVSSTRPLTEELEAWSLLRAIGDVWRRIVMEPLGGRNLPNVAIFLALLHKLLHTFEQLHFFNCLVRLETEELLREFLLFSWA